MFKTELHCHSNDVSSCARVDVDTIIKRYTEGGYTSLVLTNHLSIYTYDYIKPTDWNDFIDKFVGGYKKLKEAAGEKLNILFGMELRFKNSCNDYLVFGVTEEFLRANEDLLDMYPEKFHNICKENGYLFIQAHPFRNWMSVTPPDQVDGVEVFNGHKGHDSRNDIANMWADKFNLIKTSGTDFHYADVPTNAGIMTEYEIKDINTLIDTLKSGNYTLIKE